ncbi:MAG: WYL domain-containing protein [Hyphomicrobiales bacterium]
MTDSRDRRWSVDQRLRFIEERLFWLGSINRANIIDRFGVSIGQASADINRYLAFRPKDVLYDKSAKRYKAGDNFMPLLGPPDTSRLLGEFRLAGLGVLDAGATMLGAVPPFDQTPVPERSVDATVLRAVCRAIFGAAAIEIGYQSMSRAEPVRRLIEPHALVYDGYRWHARAWDRETASFRDFVLARMSEPARAGTREKDPGDDRAWTDWIELRIAPHPALTPAQATAIRRDYAIEGDSAVIKVREALLFYALKRLGLDTPPEARPPQEQQIVLVNRDEVLRRTTDSGPL